MKPRLRVTKTITEMGREVSKYVDYPCVNNPQNLNRLKSEINHEYYFYTNECSQIEYCFIISKWDQESCMWVNI